MFSDQVAEVSAGLLLEEALQMRRAELNLNGQLADRAGGLRFNAIQHFVQPPFPKKRLEASALGCRAEHLRLFRGQGV